MQKVRRITQPEETFFSFPKLQPFHYSEASSTFSNDSIPVMLGTYPLTDNRDAITGIVCTKGTEGAS
ncbi:hypothetical protein SDC9_210829 [bioreactor metagenome]|uniref:Uncharacterized protein n=1 Tax=bioreactor metagenome TaxID=1076179 RepID=A0A645JHA8_9ZZZZ